MSVGLVSSGEGLDLHKSDKLSHGLLGCWILTQHRAMVAV